MTFLTHSRMLAAALTATLLMLGNTASANPFGYGCGPRHCSPRPCLPRPCLPRPCPPAPIVRTIKKVVIEYKTVMETRFRMVKKTKYREELVTIFVDKPCVVEVPVTKIRVEKVDHGCWAMKPVADACGCVCFKKVWVSKIEFVQVPYTVLIKKTVIKKVPTQIKKQVPFVVMEKEAYQVPVKVACQRVIEVPVVTPCNPHWHP